MKGESLSAKNFFRLSSSIRQLGNLVSGKGQQPTIGSSSSLLSPPRGRVGEGEVAVRATAEAKSNFDFPLPQAAQCPRFLQS